MKIVLVYNNKQSRIGGVETWLISLYRTFRAWGHDCKLFWLGTNLIEDNDPAKVDSLSGTLAELARFVENEKYDIVHATTADWDAGLSLIHRLVPGMKLLLTNQLEVSGVWNSSNCDALTSCSAWAAKEQQSLTDLRIRVIENGIDTDRFIPPDRFDNGTPIVGWIGRGSALNHKRIDVLASAAPFLHKSGIRLRLADPDGPSKVIPEAAKVLAPIAEFWESVPRERMPEFLRQVAASGGCVLSTAAYEGLPLALAEAQASGCPVVAADVRGVNECVDPGNGGTLYPLDMPPEQLSRLIFDLLKSPLELAEKRTASIEHVRRRFSLALMAKKYVEAYIDVLRQRTENPERKRRSDSARRRFRTAVKERWSAGNSQYEAALQLAQRSEWKLARLAAQTAFRTCPSIYARPGRLMRFVRSVTGMH